MKSLSLARLQEKPQSIDTHALGALCDGNNGNVVALAASFRLKQTWNEKNEIRGTKMLVSCSCYFFLLVRSFREPREKLLCTNIYLIDAMVWDLHCLISFSPWSPKTAKLPRIARENTKIWNRSKRNNRKDYEDRNIPAGKVRWKVVRKRIILSSFISLLFNINLCCVGSLQTFLTFHVCGSS